jgi:hypothetical protein
MERQIAILESDINCLKREKEVEEQNYNRRKQFLLAQSMMAISEQRRREFFRQLMELDQQWREENNKMNLKIYLATQALNDKKRQQQ